MGEADPRSLPEVSDDLPITAIPRRIYHPSMGKKSHEHLVAHIRRRTLLAPWRVSATGLAGFVPGATDAASPVGHARGCVRVSVRRSDPVFTLFASPLGSAL